MLYLQPAIRLTTGEVALCDLAHFDHFKARQSRSITIHGVTYAYYVEEVDGVRRWVYWHHVVLPDCPPGMVRHHANGRGLDNRSANLCVCTYSENRLGARKRGGCSSQFVGVDICHGRYRGRIRPPGGEVVNLGLFDTEIEAAHARDRKALELHGPFARLNLPLEP